MKTSLNEDATRELFSRLHEANASFAMLNPGEPLGRQPVHTVYGGAHLYSAGSAQKLGSLALAALDRYAPTEGAFAEVFGLTSEASRDVYGRVRAKLVREPVEDYRIDFEDGYGYRSPSEEDGHAESAALEVAKGLVAGALPPFMGIRIKPLTSELAARGARTLDVFVTTLWKASGGRLPANFVVTLPKVMIPEQVSALAELFDILESNLNIPRGTLKLEMMVETLRALIDASGRLALPGLLDAADGRCVAAHFGAYDYTAELGVAAAEQRLSHPACDFARSVMQASLGRTGLWLSDGATNVLPVPVHREAPGGPALTEAQASENREAVCSGWRLHYSDVRRSLSTGFNQGWDLHPAQLVSRYAALYSFFAEGKRASAARLAAFVSRAAQATLAGSVFDDAATGQGLLNYFLRAIGSGAMTEAEVHALTGLSAADLRARSFAQITSRRQGE